jgi:transcriptional antiterminator
MDERCQAAAAAAYLVAQRRNRYVSITSLADIFYVSPSSISNKAREAAGVIYNT